MKQLGEYMQQQRLNAGFSQSAVAAACGFSTPQMVSNIERGVVIPSPKYLNALSRLTGTPPEVLVSKILPVYKADLLQAIKEAK